LNGTTLTKKNKPTMQINLFGQPSEEEEQPKKQKKNIDEGYICKCCGGLVKRYTRSMNANMCRALILLYKNREKGFVHVEKLLQENNYKRCGDYTYLRWYKLIEPLLENRPDGSSRNGYYRITGLGILFAENKSTVQEKFLMFQNECQGFKGADINIVQALGVKFDYLALMQGS
jgi:hypothetical protein